ncbi:DUF6232 family protein [Micromonospora sp. WMMD1102]|uniref:DUF6232 family protein n=1 Tax=Micromonosporaceae TaxID=28056 RepID=UPI0024156F61|nr:DUF6232 family protein [Micromonospora sp. WMMD1102]MDG4785395.1 DUF6232 family protein [Micromonospora sp. WMMD1102]
MTLYYRDDTVRVTSETIHANGRTVPVAEVSYVWHARGPGTARTRGRLAGRGVLILLLSIPPLVAMVCVLSLAYSAQDRGQWQLAAIVLAACVVGVLALLPFLELPLYWLDRSYERGVKVQELWVQYRGGEVMLLRSSDALRFGQIYRAVQRAVEQHAPEG